jgi:glutamate-5-semialdehyde dehydrogenase
MQESRIPMIKHLDGVCHVYIDDKADIDKAVRIADNAKTPASRHLQYDGNVTDCSRHCRHAYFRRLQRSTRKKALNCAAMKRRAASFPIWCLRPRRNWYTEYLAAILSVRVVDGLDAAIDHIGRYGSQHTDAIIQKINSVAQRFLREAIQVLSS